MAFCLYSPQNLLSLLFISPPPDRVAPAVLEQANIKLEENCMPLPPGRRNFTLGVHHHGLAVSDLSTGHMSSVHILQRVFPSLLVQFLQP